MAYPRTAMVSFGLVLPRPFSHLALWYREDPGRAGPQFLHATVWLRLCQLSMIRKAKSDSWLACCGLADRRDVYSVWREASCTRNHRLQYWHATSPIGLIHALTANRLLASAGNSLPL